METINGYSVNDKSRLQAEIEQFRKKRNTSLGVGITMSVIAIIAIIVCAVLMTQQMMAIAEDAASHHETLTESELISQVLGFYLLIVLFGFVETAGNIVALAGGISNHVKMANRRRTLERLRNLE